MDPKHALAAASPAAAVVAAAFAAALALAAELGEDPEPCLARAWNQSEQAGPDAPGLPLMDRPLSLLRRIHALMDQEPEWSSDELDWISEAFGANGWPFHDPNVCDGPPACTHFHHADDAPEALNEGGQAGRAANRHGVIGYGLHPAAYAGVVTVCRECLSERQSASFEDAYGSDASGEITWTTVDDEDPVHCDVCGALVHPGNRPDEDDEEEPDYETGPAVDGFGQVYSDADPGL